MNATEPVDPSITADDFPYPPDIVAALRGSRIEYITGEEEIPVRIFGEREAGIPVIMAHGLQSHSGWFAQSAQLVASAGRPVYAMDRRGSGLSRGRRGDCRDFREMVEDVRAAAEHAMELHGASQVHVLGHCFGAVPAAAFACRYPAMVRSLILPTPGLYTFTTVGFAQKIRIILSLLTGGAAPIPVPLAAEMFSDLERYRAFIRGDRLSLKEATARFFSQVPRARRFIEKNTGRLAMPVFMALAGKDGICDNGQNRAFFDRLPSKHKRLVTYRGARHILEYSSERETFFADLKGWFDEA